MENFRIKCITWNVKTTWPEEDLHNLCGLLKTTTESDPALPDIYFICLQEVRSQPHNFLMDTLFEEPWTSAFRNILGRLGYVRLTGERLQGVVTSIFLKKHLITKARQIHFSVLRTGLGGLWGNKGAVATRFNINGCSMCVVNCHLAAHDYGYEERCLHYNSIIDNVQFPITPTFKILYHDYVFWLGDLNFRLTGSMTSEDIVKKVLSGDLESLEKTDELRKAQSLEDAMAPLTEGPLTFHPTYKYQLNSSSYDLSRRPAWTDRILHQVHSDAYENVRLHVEQTQYTSCLSYKQSDHKPVIADYTIKVFSNYNEKCVRFHTIKEWHIGGLNIVKYDVDADVTTSPWDYITMLKETFTSVNQYVTYAYVPQVSALPNGQSKSDRTFQLRFNDELVQTPGTYVLLYYSDKYKSYLGMSEPFPVVLLARS